ncbi:MAG: hypothetical protein CMO01_01220 [Thalassobius sp.]|nr:hypothetical protein [Thalassovita sp.]
MAKKKKKKNNQSNLQSMKVAASNTLKTRVVKSKKTYTRKMKHQKDHFPLFFASNLEILPLAA